jgi:autonomous glycyl radical cofactor GrcA
LDIAFHDTVLIVLFGIFIPSLLSKATTVSSLSSFSLHLKNDHNVDSDLEILDKNNYNEYIKMFWVGLMDGDGSIQVNHWREQSLQYRLIIKLSNLKSNYNMLIEVAKVVGGTVRITGRQGADVIWVVNKKQDVEEIIKIYDTYPPLTSRKICQLAFLKTCLTETSVETYLLNRKLKYDKQLTIIKSNINFNIPSYFKGWLSGFIEAEGCFSIRKSNNHSFSIGQNDDLYLIDAIKQYFEVTNKVRNPYGEFYFLEVYKKEVLLKIITHCTNYPLLGEKLESLKKISQKLS